MNGWLLAVVVLMVWIFVGYVWIHIAYEMLEKEFKWYDILITLPAIIILLIINDIKNW